MSSKKELLEILEDSTYIYKRNMVNRYQIRLYENIDKLCYALFLKRYQLEQKQIGNDSQRDELIDEAAEVDHASVSSFQKVLKLSSGEKLRCLKVELVLQYHVPNQRKDREGHAHHLLFMIYPFHDEFELSHSMG